MRVKNRQSIAALRPHKMRRKSAWDHSAITLVAGLVVAVAGRTALADFQWNVGTTGAFENPLNWTLVPGNTPTATFPGINDNVLFTDGGVGFATSDFSNSITISGNSNWTLGNVQYTVQTETDISGNLAITGPGPTQSAFNPGVLMVGTQSAGGGSLNVSNTLVSATLSVLGFAANNTTTTFDTGSSWSNVGNMVVGWDGANTQLTVQNGATLFNFDTIGTGSGIGGAFDSSDIQHSGSGSVTVTGAGSKWTENSTICIGCLGNGNLTISNGGTVACDSAQVADAIDPFTNLVNPAGTGVVTVDGDTATSNWNITSNLDIGVTGVGTVFVKNGGKLNVGNFIGLGEQSIGNGTIDVTSGSTVKLGTNGFVQVGINSGSSGTIQVTSNSTFDAGGGTLFVGSSGQGQLKVTSGAQVSNIGFLAIGAQTGGDAGDIATVTDGGTLLSASTAYVGDLGSGELDVQNLGTFKLSGGGSLIVGFDSKASGTVNLTNDLVRGAGGGTLDANGCNVYVGYGGLGTLNITAGQATNINFLSIGSQAGNNAQNAVNLDGSSLFNISPMLSAKTIYVGDQGTGNLSLINGASAQLTSGGFLDLGVGPKTLGIFKLTNSTFDANGNPIFIGDSGLGAIALIKQSAITNVSFASLGVQSGGDGRLFVGDPFSMVGDLISTVDVGSLFVGDGGQGNLEIVDGSILNLNSGAMTVGNQLNSAGTVLVSTLVFGPNKAAATLDAHENDVFLGVNGNGRLFLNHSGLVKNVGAIYAGVNSAGSGTIDVENSGSMLTIDGSLTLGQSGNGKMIVQSGARVSAKRITVAQLSGSSASISLSGSSNDATPTLLKTDFMDVGGSSDNPEQNGGTATVSAGKVSDILVTNTLNTWDHATISASPNTNPPGLPPLGGSILVGSSLSAHFGSDGDIDVVQGGTIAGTGTFVGSFFNAGGTVKPGHSAGILTIQGDYSQSSDGTLDIELGGQDPGTGYGQLLITGNATLDGTLDVSFLNGFVPSIGETFDIVSAANLTGAFSSVQIDGPVTFDLNYTNGGLELQTLSVPEPATSALLLPLAALICLRRPR